jgi:flavin reductase (DIM6/NTAB) family NADH-FMN oxidoreductase RutF
MDTHFYEPAQGHGLAHDPFNAIVAPRPIGWISSQDAEGRLNLAPYSFFNAYNYRPPLVGFTSIGRKDSLSNAEATGEFCWSLATKALADQMNASSASVPHEVDEFQLSGLTPTPSRLVKPPRVAESPVSFECRVSQIVQLQAADGRQVKTWLVLGEVVGVHIDKAYLTDGVYETAAPRPILRAGGLDDYAEITPKAMFKMMRPA